jgi:3-deoxy-manno-octulosonate cytidylyltransferase (CMP-KDO synthetase)
VATDHEVIYKHVKDFGGDVVMTATTHASGTERCAEAARIMVAENEALKPEVIVNIQGDEPFIHPEQIDQVLACFGDSDTRIATLSKCIAHAEDLSDPNVVKVVCDLQANALLFSRSAIPFVRNGDPASLVKEKLFFKHIGIYAYRYETLLQLIRLPHSRLEQAESLEQLRWMEHGFRIRVGETDLESHSVDTPGDLLKITNTIPAK